MGDYAGAELAQARAAVYESAAAIAKGLAPDEAGVVFAQHELRHHFGPAELPLAAFHEAGLQHVRAMAWQLCARSVNPAHQGVEMPW